jgi:hypothetical protein
LLAMLRIDRDGREDDPAAEVASEPVLHQGHHRRQHRATGGAAGEDEITAATLPRRLASEIGAPSCEVRINPGAAATFGSAGVSDDLGPASGKRSIDISVAGTANAKTAKRPRGARTLSPAYRPTSDPRGSPVR